MTILNYFKFNGQHLIFKPPVFFVSIKNTKHLLLISFLIFCINFLFKFYII
jgi:hypothetical protein